MPTPGFGRHVHTCAGEATHRRSYMTHTFILTLTHTIKRRTNERSWRCPAPENQAGVGWGDRGTETGLVNRMEIWESTAVTCVLEKQSNEGKSSVQVCGQLSSPIRVLRAWTVQYGVHTRRGWSRTSTEKRSATANTLRRKWRQDCSASDFPCFFDKRRLRKGWSCLVHSLRIQNSGEDKEATDHYVCCQEAGRRIPVLSSACPPWCRPHSGWVFSLRLNFPENILIDTFRGVFPWWL